MSRVLTLMSSAWLSILVLLTMALPTQAAAPRVTSFSPTSGEVGQAVTITGTAFTGATAVKFNVTAATDFTVLSDTSITAAVPVGASTGKIGVTSPEGTGSSFGSFFVNPPAITSFTPTSGVAGNTVTVTGRYFTGATAVKFNGSTASSFSVVSDTSLTTVVPVGVTSGKITVTTPNGTATSAGNFSVTPTLTAFAPTSGKVGDSVTITGTAFTGATGVSFNGTAASSFTVVSNTSVKANVPLGATTGQLSVTTPGGTATSVDSFTVYQPPTIVSFTPLTGLAGDTVMISGTNFTGTTAVKFNTTGASSYTVDSDTSISAVVPAGVLSGKISVTAPGGTVVSAASFYVTPSLTAFTPTSGKAGDSVTITGTAFNGATAVSFNGTPASSFTIVSNTSVKANVPVGATTGQLSVTTPGGTATSVDSFTVYQPPTIISFTPSSGSVGDTVTITGTYLTGASAVKFNGTGATSFTVDSDISITATVPFGASSGKITVTTPGGTATSATDFNTAPSISSFTPASGVIGQDVTIIGTGFIDVTAVKFNGVTDPSFFIDSGKIYARVPVGASTGPITVTNSFGTATSATNFTVITAPAISSFSPTSGVAGDTITVTGTQFTGALAVKFNGVTAASFSVVDDTSITAKVPATATSGKITVTTAAGTATSSDTFYINPPTIGSFTPTNGDAGTFVTVSGTGLTGATSVKFNGIAAGSFAVYSDTSIAATVPVGATTGPITVTTPAGTATSATDFIVNAVPTITSFTPEAGIAGVTVTITGTSFTGATGVKFNGSIAVSFTVDSDTTITATVPVGTTTGKITVTTPGGTATSSGYFYVNPPVISSFSPASGVSGQEVTITGTNLTAATAVKFNGMAASYYVVSDTSITTYVPFGATTGKLSVINPVGAATSVTDFTVYVATSLDVTIDPGLGYIGTISSIALNYSLNGPQAYTGALTPDSSGKSTISGLQPGTYSLSIYGSHWLIRKVVIIEVNGVNSVQTFLTNGDADGGNSVNLFDFVVLDSLFGSSNAMADLDGDGNVNLFDYAIIDQNFDALGD